jgi:hypothetical protein
MAVGDRYKVERIWVQGDAGPEPITVGGPLLPAPFSKARTGVMRSDAALLADIQPVRADSVEEVCDAYDVRITGTYVDVDDSTKHVNLRVKNERSFTVDEITRRHTGLRQRYIEMRLCDALARDLATHPDLTLGEAEVAALREQLDLLERSLPPETEDES